MVIFRYLLSYLFSGVFYLRRYYFLLPYFLFFLTFTFHFGPVTLPLSDAFPRSLPLPLGPQRVLRFFFHFSFLHSQILSVTPSLFPLSTSDSLNFSVDFLNFGD